LVKSQLYIPDKGDVIWLNFNPQTGHEQAGKRPAMVVTPMQYNKVTGLGLFCPVTSKIKNYPFEVKIPEGFGISGVILADHVKNLDWKAREAELIFSLPKDIFNEVISKFKVLIDY
jgi:mRNA interferase MazF